MDALVIIVEILLIKLEIAPLVETRNVITAVRRVMSVVTVLSLKRKSLATVAVKRDISHVIAPMKRLLEPTEVVMVVVEIAVEQNVTNAVRRDILLVTVIKVEILLVEDIRVEVDMVVEVVRHVIPAAGTDICLGIVPKGRNATTVVNRVI